MLLGFNCRDSGLLNTLIPDRSHLSRSGSSASLLRPSNRNISRNCSTAVSCGSGWVQYSSGAWIRTKDLRVMSPTSCHCSTPHRLLSLERIFPFQSARYYSTLPHSRQGAPLSTNNHNHICHGLTCGRGAAGVGVGRGVLPSGGTGTIGLSPGRTKFPSWYAHSITAASDVARAIRV